MQRQLERKKLYRKKMVARTDIMLDLDTESSIKQNILGVLGAKYL